MACLALMTDAFGGRGGIAQYNRDFAGALAAMGEIGQIDILPRHAPDAPGALPVKTTQEKARPGRLAYAQCAFRAAARAAPDVIFCGHLFMAPLAAAIARQAGARLVLQTHGVEVWDRPSVLQRKAAESADLILAVSRDTRAKVLDWAAVPPERVRVAPNTVAADFSPGDRAAARARLGFGEAFVILTVGRLAAGERYKGHDRIIPLLAQLSVDGREVVYIVAGDGDDRPRLEALARQRGVEDRVRFLGLAPAVDLPDLYRAADVFVLPSTGEGFGIVLLEAMACGTPALALCAGGATDALADGVLGTLVDEALLPAALKRFVREAPRDPALADRVRARFDRACFERRIAGALAPLLSGGRTDERLAA